MLLDSKNIYYYLIGFSLIVFVNFFGTKLKEYFEEKNNDYELIQKYLLNDDSHLEGVKSKPKIWIHTKYEINARKWKDFYSRNTTDLNQPYIHLTIKTIIDHCSEDFNICLIDDETFSKIIPNWDIDLPRVTEPIKSNMREFALMQLLYIYGGMIVPNTFICTKNLKNLYYNGINGNKPFVCENVNHTCNMVRHKKRLAFVPDTFFMGAKKRDPTIKKMMELIQEKNRHFHFNSEYAFLGDTTGWCMDAIDVEQMNLIDGENIGVKTRKQKPVFIENLMEEEPIDFSNTKYGIYIPGDQVLSRVKYQWFAVMPTKDLLKTNMIVTKHLLVTLGDKNSVTDGDDSDHENIKVNTQQKMLAI